MNLTSRITSVVNATPLDTVITGISTFFLSELKYKQLPEITLPVNRRLGHLIEKVVSELINASENYQLLHENVQIVQNKQTIGELDFIIQHTETKEIIHLELAYKFYLYDASISDDVSKNWIGPNRRDALHEKIAKLQQKQLPLLYHEATKTALPYLKLDSIIQKVCVLSYLYLPYTQKIALDADYQKAVAGYYMNFETFQRLDNPAKAYHIPSKKAWGIHPASNENWSSFEDVKEKIKHNLTEKRALLCWQKHKDTFETFFIVWW
ncbi:hypothetical protein C8N46_10818 [Kordia periserrulae]|uniref:DUF1853 family protein n=1 Tax=Kordia periserrulae TaxID=701523 RepID=A0A2T6BUE6_9FLAO|nr:DUF1853 family protein [Kordia periserrulae]PTX59708.1 hypothetical protein C8N46_10818 [Kordia periserrulae]